MRTARWTARAATVACLPFLLCRTVCASGEETVATNQRESAEFIFFSNRVFQPDGDSAAERATIRRFRVCLTNGYVNFTGQDRDTLQTAGCELFIYLWFNGYYVQELGRTAEASRFPEMQKAFQTVQAHPEWLLNPERPLQGAGAAEPAYFYDYGNPAFRAYYIGFIRDRLQRTGYHGVFFDYIGGWALPEAAKTLWHDRYPDRSYDAAGLAFLRELRQAIPDLRLFGNQAYRLSIDYEDVLDYDLTESHGTSFVWGKEAQLFVEGKGRQTVRETFYRPWDGPAGYRAISRPVRAMADKHPRVRIFDLNYLQSWYLPTGTHTTIDGKQVPIFAPRVDRPAIFYGYALAKVIGLNAFASDWYAPGYGRDELYFADLGPPVEPTFHEAPSVVTRYYRNGFVAVTRRSGEVEFVPDEQRLPRGITALWDLYAQQRVPIRPGHHGVVIRPASYPAAQQSYPSGRVYLYLFR